MIGQLFLYILFALLPKLKSSQNLGSIWRAGPYISWDHYGYEKHLVLFATSTDGIFVCLSLTWFENARPVPFKSKAIITARFPFSILSIANALHGESSPVTFWRFMQTKPLHIFIGWFVSKSNALATLVSIPFEYSLPILASKTSKGQTKKTKANGYH